MDWTVSGGQQCALAPENQMAAVSCGDGDSIADISFASFGTPVGGCGAGLASNASCHSDSSLQVVKKLCIGLSNCSVPATAAAFGGDPCFGHFKRLAIVATCKAPPSLNVQLDLAPDSTASLYLPLLGMQVQTSLHCIIRPFMAVNFLFCFSPHPQFFLLCSLNPSSYPSRR
jgi:hypothetical protein